MVSEATAYLRREVSTRNDKFTVNLGFWPAAPHPRRSRPEEPRWRSRPSSGWRLRPR